MPSFLNDNWTGSGQYNLRWHVIVHINVGFLSFELFSRRYRSFWNILWNRPVFSQKDDGHSSVKRNSTRCNHRSAKFYQCAVNACITGVISSCAALFDGYQGSDVEWSQVALVSAALFWTIDGWNTFFPATSMASTSLLYRWRRISDST